MICLSLFAHTSFVSPGAFLLESLRICTARPACQLENSLACEVAREGPPAPRAETDLFSKALCGKAFAEVSNIGLGLSHFVAGSAEFDSASGKMAHTPGLYLSHLPVHGGLVAFDPYQTHICRSHPPLEWDQFVCFQCLNLYHKSPDHGERQYKSRT